MEFLRDGRCLKLDGTGCVHHLDASELIPELATKNPHERVEGAGNKQRDRRDQNQHSPEFPLNSK